MRDQGGCQGRSHHAPSMQAAHRAGDYAKAVFYEAQEAKLRADVEVKLAKLTGRKPDEAATKVQQQKHVEEVEEVFTPGAQAAKTKTLKFDEAPAVPSTTPRTERSTRGREAIR